jgi:hypothetical protein
MARPRRRGAWRGQSGLSLVETLVGIGLATLLLLGLMAIWGASWRTEREAMTDSDLNRVARDTLSAIVNGDPTFQPPLQGLIRANAVLTSPALSALAFRVTWIQGSGVSAVAHDDEIAYYLAGGTLYRVVADYVAPLNILTAGGTAVTDHVASFILTTNTGPEPIGITLTVASPFGTSLTLQTTVLPRNVPR